MRYAIYSMGISSIYDDTDMGLAIINASLFGIDLEGAIKP